MRTARGVCAGCALMAALTTLARTAHAAEGTPPIWLDYRAPPECPSREELLEGLRARTDRFRLVDASGIGVATYRITRASTAQRADGSAAAVYTGHLEIVDPAGASAQRDLAGATCQDVADAISLVASLGIDPNATVEPAPSPPGEPRLPLLPPLPVLEGAPHDPSRTRLRLHGSAALAVSAVAGTFPSIVASPTATLESTLRWAPRQNGIHAVLSVRLTFERGSTTAAGAETESAELTWTAARLDVCPVEAVFGRFDALGCIGAEGGTLEAAGRGVTTHNDVVDPWFALGPLLRLRSSILGPWFVEVELAAMAPWFRQHIYFDRPPSDVDDVPPLAGRAALGTGVGF